jgi:hypothetical protein
MMEWVLNCILTYAMKRVKLDNEHWYDMPKFIETSEAGKITVLWNQQVKTDRTIPNNNLDVIIHDNKRGSGMLIDAAISGDRNVIKKEAERL